MASGAETFSTVLASDHHRVFVPLPFDPGDVWGRKQRHHVKGTINTMGVRGVVERIGEGPGLVLGQAWRRGCGLAAGDAVSVTLMPEGPQREDLPADVASALEAEPEAGEFFDSLAQFYRKRYLTWIGSTKRRPELRAQRIAEMVVLLKSGEKQKP